METVWIWPALALVGLVILSAFFSGSETALIGSGRIRLNHLAEGGNRGARRALELLREPSELLATILVGNNLVNVMAAAVATVLFGPVKATVLVTLLLLVFAEITPKTLATLMPERLAMRVSGPIRVFSWLFLPVVWVTSGISQLMLWPVVRDQEGRARRFSRKELITAINLGARDGELEPAETRMTREVLALKDIPVRRIMIPLENVDAISEAATFDDILREFVETENTRYPVYRQDVSDMIGLLLVKDLLAHLDGARENWRRYVRPLMRVNADLEADELLRDMQINRSHMAAVEDEQGEIIGIITMEDILEEIVGDIQDETDEEEGELIREYSSGRYLVSGRVEVDDLCKLLNVDLGRSDQQQSLAQWFGKRCQSGCQPARRLRLGNVTITPRAGGRFEIRVRDAALARRQPGDDAGTEES